MGQNLKTHPDAPEQNSEFQLGQIVLLKSTPTVKGAVVDVILDEKENRFMVFIDGGIQNFLPLNWLRIYNMIQRQHYTMKPTGS